MNRVVTTLVVSCLLPVSAMADDGKPNGIGASAYGINQTNVPEQEGARILSKLLYTDITVEFKETNIQDAIEYLNSILGIKIVPRFDNDQGRTGIDPETHIVLEVIDRSALSVLEQILYQCQTFGETCTWQLRKGYIEIGPKSRLNLARETRTYAIDDLTFEAPLFDNGPSIDLNSALNSESGGGGNSSGGSGGFGNSGDGGGSENIFDPPDKDGERSTHKHLAEELIEIITQVIEPDEWLDGGGSASIRYWRGNLIVIAPDYIHRQIDGYKFKISPVKR